MGRAARRRAEQRASVTAKVFTTAPRPTTGRLLPWPVREGLEELGTLKQARDDLDAAITALVHDLAERGASWGDVGRALHLTRQGARQRYAARN